MIRKFELFILLGILFIVSIFSLNWVIKGTIHSQKNVLVPDIVGQPLNRALTSLSEQNLALKQLGTEFNDSIPAGTVIRQQPVAGMSVREGRIIRVTLSQGGETTYVPNLEGASLRSAEIALRTQLLALGEIQYKSSIKYEKDYVISQSPPAQKIVGKDTLVHLVVSNGAPEDGIILMPEFVGKKLPEAEAWGQKNNITVQSELENSLSEQQTILEQNVAADTAMRGGDAVKFMIASGKQSATAGSETQNRKYFPFQVPQSDSPKTFRFVLVDGAGSREIFGGPLLPGTKHQIPLPSNLTIPAQVRIFVNGILTEERQVQ